MEKKKDFSAVKHVKKLSRTMVRTIPGRPIRPKKERLIKKIAERESRELSEET